MTEENLDGIPLQNTINRKGKFQVHCLWCQNEYTTIRNQDGYCTKDCRKQDYKKREKIKQQEKYKNISSSCFVQCPICKDHMSRIDVHLKRMHGIDSKTFQELYPGYPVLSKEVFDKMSSNIKGNKNPGYQHGGKLSPFSKNFVGYADKSEEEIKTTIYEMATTAQQKSKENGNLALTIEYYIKRGYDQEEAEEMLSDRQRTFTLEKCIETHGLEKGTKIWQERQDKWLATLDAKTDEEKAEINRKKIPLMGISSKKGDELAEKLSEIFPDLKTQLVIQREDEPERFYVYDIYVGNKIIEFNGDLFHASPLKYDADDVPKFPGNERTASEIWQKDFNKLVEAEHAGYELMTVWEKDYDKNKKQIIEECISFLRQ